MIKEVETMHEHFRRQATPEVWAEVDALRRRVAKLEEALRALQGLRADAQAIEAQRAEAENTDSVHESAVAKGDAPEGNRS